jgi:hypothetical protein
VEGGLVLAGDVEGEDDGIALDPSVPSLRAE